jgi:hypothetical protein
MSKSNEHPTGFAYHAQALGFSASLRKPCCENIPGQAAISLSRTGGETYSVVRNFDWKGIFRFEEAASYVSGSFDHGSFNTLATVTVRGLNIANMITADQIIARVSTRHDYDANSGEVGEGLITLDGSSFQNLRIAGRQITLRVNARACVRKNFDALSGFAEENGGMRLRQMQAASCSIAAIEDAEDLEYRNGTIEVPEFGTIYLATVIFQPGYQRISMIRAELGCPVGGNVESGGGEGNGTGIWQ